MNQFELKDEALEVINDTRLGNEGPITPNSLKQLLLDNMDINGLEALELEKELANIAYAPLSIEEFHTIEVEARNIKKYHEL